MGFERIGRAIQEQRSDDQVLILDWRSAAKSSKLGGEGESFILPVAEKLADILATHGFDGTRLNFIGHSWGSYVAAEAAEIIPGGVNSIVALDPATNYPGGSYNPNKLGQIDFGRNAAYSWAFHEAGSDIYGSTSTPLTAHESFVVVRGSDHSRIVELFADLIMLPEGNSVGSRFRLDRLVQHWSSSSWSPNRYNDSGDRRDYGGWYEAVLQADANGVSVESLTYVDEGSYRELTRDA